MVPEFDLTAGQLFTDKPALVNKVMVMPAKHYEVVQTRLPAICPVLYVVSIDKTGVGTARKATSFVSDA